MSNLITGTDWLRHVQKVHRRVKREDPAAFTVLMAIRDTVLNLAADGEIDLARPLTVAYNNNGVVIQQDETVTA